MTYKTRKRIWPVALMSLAVFGLLAAAVALYVLPTGTAQAHGCDPSDVQCFVEHGAEGLDPNDPNHEHPDETNTAPTVAMTLEDISLRVRQSRGPIDVSGVFEDADGDTLTYGASSDNESVANATIAGSQMTIVAGDVRGSARITVTADDSNGGMVSTGFDVMVAEAYTLTASNPGDPMLPDPPTDPDTADPYEDLRGIPHSATYLVLQDGPLYPRYDAHFSLGVAGSLDDVTVTITATEMLNITIVDSDGLINAGFVDDEETDLEGSLTVKATDQGSRAFEIEGECESPGGWAHILVEDKDLAEVAEGAIYCKPADEIIVDPDEFRSDMMTVVSYNDWDHWEKYETVSDGFIIVDEDPDENVEHMVNQDQKNNVMGILLRDEPVVDTYQLAISEKEYLTLKAGEDPDRLTKAEAEEGQHTIEVMAGADYVQLTVTSTMAGPAYIRFLDKYMQPFGTDVDEEPMWRGADVVGLDSQGRLALNLMPNLTKAKALAYDQYLVVVPGDADSYAYLYGLAGDYHQGAFRVFNPCPSVGHHFYVEVYESEGKYRKTTEKVMCVTSPRPGPTGLEFTVDSQEVGEGVLTYRHARNASSHTVLVVDAHSRTIVAGGEITNAPETVRFKEDYGLELNDGWGYNFIVVAHGVSGQYTADAVTAEVNWINHADAAPSRLTAGTPTRSHIVCQTDNAEVMALLADCDTTPPPPAELGAPTSVTATIDNSDPGEPGITVTWMDGANADVHDVGLIDLSDYSVYREERIPGVPSAMTHTFDSVASGRYMAIVVSTSPTDPTDYKYGVAIVTVP